MVSFKITKGFTRITGTNCWECFGLLIFYYSAVGHKMAKKGTPNSKNALKSLTLTFWNTCFICFNEIPLKIMKNAFYLILKALLVPLKFLCWRFGHLLNNELIRKICFKTYDIAAWLTNNYNTHIAQYPAK